MKKNLSPHQAHCQTSWLCTRHVFSSWWLHLWEYEPPPIHHWARKNFCKYTTGGITHTFVFSQPVGANLFKYNRHLASHIFYLSTRYGRKLTILLHTPRLCHYYTHHRGCKLPSVPPGIGTNHMHSGRTHLNARTYSAICSADVM